MIADPETPRKILDGEIEKTLAPEANIHLLHLLGWNNLQLERLADGLDPDLDLSGEDAAPRFAELEQGNFQALLQRRSA